MAVHKASVEIALHQIHRANCRAQFHHSAFFTIASLDAMFFKCNTQSQYFASTCVRRTFYFVCRVPTFLFAARGLFCFQRAIYFVCSVRIFLFEARIYFVCSVQIFLFVACGLFYLQRADLFCSQCADLFSLQCILFCEMCNFLLGTDRLLRPRGGRWFSKKSSV